MVKQETLLAPCGLHCEDCFSHQGRIADLARDLRKELRQVRFDKVAEALSGVSWFKALEHYDKCYEALGVMVKLRCRKGCRKGGGNPSCKIRTCSNKKGLAGCWECAEFEKCGKMDFLKTTHGTAHLKNLRLIRKNGVEGFIKGKRHWYAK